MSVWRRLVCAEPISLDFCFRNGQCFGWHKWTDGQFTGVLRNAVVSLRNVTVDKNPLSVEYCCHHPPDATNESIEAELHSLFHTSVELGPIVESWIAWDERIRDLAARFHGIRFLRQDPQECLMSFICSSNNNIARITKILASVRETFGTPLCTLRDKTFYSFPPCEVLAGVGEDALRRIGVGYRAKYILASAALLRDKGGDDWLASLRSPTISRADAQTQLLEFAGVGRKVADCVAVFSLDKYDVIPVDTHVWTIALRDFGSSALRSGSGAVKSLTPTVYDKIGDLFRERYGPYAGWAHSLLFSAEIPAFRGMAVASAGGAGGSSVMDDNISVNDDDAKETKPGKISNDIKTKSTTERESSQAKRRKRKE